MKLWNSALSEFRRSLKDDAGLSSSYLSGVYFAMAIAERSLKNYDNVIDLCNQAITLQPDNPHSWNLMAYAIRMKEDSKRFVNEDKGNISKKVDEICKNIENPPHEDAEYTKFLKEKLIPSREISVALAWRMLCKSHLLSNKCDSDNQIAFYCLRNLARVYSRTEKSLVKKLADQAIYLEHNNADLYYILGKNLRETDQPEKAINALETGLSIDKSDYKLWGEIALAYAILFEKTSDEYFREKSSYACRIVLKNPYTTCKKITNGKYFKASKEASNYTNVRNALRKITQEERESEFIGLPNCKIEQVLKFIANLEEQDCNSLQDYQEQINRGSYEGNDNKWVKANIQAKLASYYLRLCKQKYNEEYLKVAETNFKEAIKIFKEKNPEAINYHEIHYELAKLYKYKRKFAESLYYAEQAVSFDPEDTEMREMLSSIHLDSQNYEMAKSQLEICCSLKPTDLNLLEKKGYACIGSAFGTSSFNVNELKKAIRDLEQSIRHHESKPLENKDREANIWNRISLYYNIGSRYIDLNNYDKAISNFSIAYNLAVGGSESEKCPIEKCLIEEGLIDKCQTAKCLIDKGLIEKCLIEKCIIEEGLIDKCQTAKCLIDKGLIEKCLIEKCIIEEGLIEEGLIILHDLGDSYRSMKKYLECESCFSEIIWMINESKRKSNDKFLPSNIVGSKLKLNDVSIGHVYAYACISLAYSYADRDSNFIKALHLTEKAEGCINNMDNSYRKTYLKSKCLGCRGWTLYRWNRLGYWYDEIDKATQCLETACSIYADAENYLHLATVHEYKLQKLKAKLRKTEIDNQNIGHFRNRALAYCDHASELDTQKKYKNSIEELKRRLEEKDSQETEKETDEAAKYKFSSTTKGTIFCEKALENKEAKTSQESK
jgi:tetratricopeptide (TPR) repeat protein